MDTYIKLHTNVNKNEINEKYILLNHLNDYGFLATPLSIQLF